MSVEQILREHIVTTYMGGDGAGLEGDTSLTELNIIDSSEIFELVHYIRAELGIDIPIEEIHAENFGTINAMARLVDRLRAPSDAAAK